MSTQISTEEDHFAGHNHLSGGALEANKDDERDIGGLEGST